jgi:hypothetical protein
MIQIKISSEILNNKIVENYVLMGNKIFHHLYDLECSAKIMEILSKYYYDNFIEIVEDKEDDIDWIAPC